MTHNMQVNEVKETPQLAMTYLSQKGITDVPFTLLKDMTRAIKRCKSLSQYNFHLFTCVLK